MSSSAILMSSPVGPLRLVSDGAALTHVLFVDGAAVDDGPIDDRSIDTRHVGGEAAGVEHQVPVLEEARQQLAAYFAGQQRTFDLPLAGRGTDFQQRVWAQLRLIPFGATASYADIAARLGMPAGASRAIGLANGANPIAVVVPCHRVIGSDGSLVGYGGGLRRKRILLALESPVVQDTLFGD